jgi:predicted GNAT superfamily acetyltransferase
MSPYEIRPFKTLEEYRGCVALQEETWGHGYSDIVPPATLKVAQILGGVAAGAWAPDGSLAGFVFGMTGVREGEIVHWSDMLVVRRGIRDSGLGTRLKAYQRSVMLERGVKKMFWTFDPLQSRNAYLNFAKLGIVVREYVQDMYGETDSPLHRGIGTDRFIASWLMDSARVIRRMAGTERGPNAEVLQDCREVLGATAPVTSGGSPCPSSLQLRAADAVVSVAIPADISGVMAESLQLAVAWREATRTVLTHYTGRGYEVRELVRGEDASHYLLYSESSR